VDYDFYAVAAFAGLLIHSKLMGDFRLFMPKQKNLGQQQQQKQEGRTKANLLNFLRPSAGCQHCCVALHLIC